MREKGPVRVTKWGRFDMARGQATPFPSEGESFSVFRYHVERGDPYPTLTRRAQFLIEHPWFAEAGEDLPCHKDSPKMGGDYPYRMTSGHNRWSAHAMNIANPPPIQTHRGAPHPVLHPAATPRGAVPQPTLLQQPRGARRGVPGADPGGLLGPQPTAQRSRRLPGSVQ